MAAILLGVSGGIAAYKAPDIISGLIKQGHTVQVVMTESAKHFIPEMSLAVISTNPVTTSLWGELDGSVNHIHLASWANAVVIAPATANIIGKIANGIGDDALSTICLAIRPGTLRVLVPAMNTYMWRSAAVQQNCAVLQERGWKILTPASGHLACGEEGEGKLPQPRQIVEQVNHILHELKAGVRPAWPLPGVHYSSHGRGKFGVVRKFDRHTGIDLYAPVGSTVVAMLTGWLHHVGPFTGPDVVCGDYPEGSGWWLPTECVVLESLVGGVKRFVLYGEIEADERLRNLQREAKEFGNTYDIRAGEQLGTVRRVLRHDKGTPTSMLHVELLKRWTPRCPVVWPRDDAEPPEELLDPTELIHEARLLQ